MLRKPSDVQSGRSTLSSRSPSPKPPGVFVRLTRPCVLAFYARVFVYTCTLSLHPPPSPAAAPVVTLRKIIRATRYAAQSSVSPSLRDVAIKVAEDAFAARNARLKAQKVLLFVRFYARMLCTLSWRPVMRLSVLLDCAPLILIMCLFYLSQQVEKEAKRAAKDKMVATADSKVRCCHHCFVSWCWFERRS